MPPLIHGSSRGVEKAVTNELFVTILSAVISLSSAGFVIYKWQTGERPKLSADIAAELIGPYREEVEKLRVEVGHLRDENAELKAKLASMEDIQDWADRLVHQVQSLGHVPVKIRTAVKA